MTERGSVSGGAFHLVAAGTMVSRDRVLSNGGPIVALMQANGLSKLAFRGECHLILTEHH